jgi:hypothetical protein
MLSHMDVISFFHDPGVRRCASPSESLTCSQAPEDSRRDTIKQSKLLVDGQVVLMANVR